jgi:hypothetical protein
VSRPGHALVDRMVLRWADCKEAEFLGAGSIRSECGGRAPVLCRSRGPAGGPELTTLSSDHCPREEDLFSDSWDNWANSDGHLSRTWPHTSGVLKLETR